MLRTDTIQQAENKQKLNFKKKKPQKTRERENLERERESGFSLESG